MVGTETSGYAHPEVLVETSWVAEHLTDPVLRLIEADEEVMLAFVVDHSEHPGNYEPLANADVSLPGGYPCCEGVLMLSVRVDTAGKVESVS